MGQPTSGWLFGAALCALLGASGCLEPAAFHCQSAEQCVSGASQGACEPTGFCSFPDEGCGSGRRYATHAGDGFAGVCVGNAPGEVDGGSIGGSPDASMDATPSSFDSAPLGDCTQGTRNIRAFGSGRCYMFFAGGKDWLAANGACLALEPGANLAAIGDQAENAVVTAVAQQAQVWVGGTDQVLEGTWLWSSSGTPVGFDNWRAGEPNDAGGEDCMLVEGNNGGLWDDRGCSKPMPYVCERG